MLKRIFKLLITSCMIIMFLPTLSSGETIVLPDETTIVLKGDNKLISGNNSSAMLSAGLYAKGSLTIKGNGLFRGLWRKC